MSEWLDLVNMIISFGFHKLGSFLTILVQLPASEEAVYNC